MKRVLFFAGLIIFLFAVPAPSSAADVELAWDASTSVDVTGYKLYVSTTSGTYAPASAVDVGDVLTYTFTGMADGTYYFVATAYDEKGNESGYSNECTTDLDATAPLPPGGLSCQQK